MSGFEISLINGLAIIVYLFALGFGLINYDKKKNYLWLLVLGFSSIAILQSISNVFEWSDVMTMVMDLMEDFFIVLMYSLAIIFAISFRSISTKRNISRKFIHIFVFFMIGIFLATTFIFFSYSYDKNAQLQDASNSLIEISGAKTEEISNYLSRMREDVQVLQESDEVEDLLKQEMVFAKSAIQMDVNQKARVIIKEVENYIKVHPEMTLEELQQNKEFQDIAVRSVGKGGYSAIYDPDSFEIYFHKKPEFIGVILSDLYNEFPALLDLIYSAKTSKEGSEGFYEWEEPDGTLGTKYGKFAGVPISIFGGKNLSVAITAYVEDYKMINTTSKFLEDYNEKGYHNVVLISPSGYVSYMADMHGVFGTDLEWEVNSNNGLANNYLDVKESQEISFYGPFIGTYGDIYPKFSAMAPVYGAEELLGYVAIVSDMKDIFDITEDVVGDGETMETYLVNRDLLLISHLKKRDFDIMVQSVKTENSENCFSMGQSEDHVGHEAIGEFLNYRGSVAVGTHKPILNVDWCLLSEINKEEVLLPLDDIMRDKVYFSFGLVFIFSLIGLFIEKYFDIGRRKGKSKERDSGRGE